MKVPGALGESGMGGVSRDTQQPAWPRQPLNPASPPQEVMRFSDLPVALAFLAKPVVDGLYSMSSVKYGYMLFIFFAALFALVGRLLSGLPGMHDSERRAYGRHAVLFAVYLSFLLILLAVYLGSLGEIFKIISPFLVFLLLAPVVGPWTIKVIGLMCLATIVGNGALLPFEQGWVYWGDVRTFKGFYYFKTDLAYALVFSTLGLAVWQRFRFTPILVVGIALATAQVVLANSRMNYLLFAVVVLFIAIKGGVRPWILVRNATAVAGLGVLAAYLYDPTVLLGFDWFNEARLTQGRNRIWEVLIEQGLMNFSLAEWLFGRGLYADVYLFAENVSTGEAHNAHNEWLHLAITQGLVGTLVYLGLWITMFDYLRARSLQPWARWVALVAFGLLLLQSMTAVVSAFATKTWPLVFVLLAVACARAPEASK